MSAYFPKEYGNRIGQKEGGIHKPDPDGGIYKNQTDVFLIKRDTEKPQNDISEYLAASIFSKTALGFGAEIELVKNTSVNANNPDNKNAFLASKYFKDYKDFFKEAGFKNRPEKLEVLQSLIPATQYVKKVLNKKNSDGSYKYTGYEQSLVTSLLLGDFSVHSGNMGVISKEKDKIKKLVRIDFGAAFRGFTDDINPFKSVKNRVGFEKNYFLRDHPRERIISEEFINELNKVSDADLKIVINEKWNNIVKNFDEKAIKDFGIQIGVPEINLSSDKIKEYFSEKIIKRQKSLKNIATEINISLAVRNNELDKIEDITRQNPEYCQSIIDNPNQTQLGEKYSKSTLQLLKSALTEEKEIIITSNTPKKPDKKSVDKIIFAELKEQNSTSIIDFIRKEIISKQISTVKKVVGANNSEINNLTLKEFKEYLKNSDIKKIVEDILRNDKVAKVFELEARKIEESAYGKFNHLYEKDFQTLKWDGPFKDNEKSQVIKNPQGIEIVKLVEKTIKSPLFINSSDDLEKKIESYRVIDFPSSINKDTGPAHLSMALKSQDGQNMKIDSAVYFTAHYNKEGKLTEISAPMPIKFTSNKPDEPCYIERNGKIFTLPVTQSKYHEMLKEVNKNQGISLNISQKVEHLSGDKLISLQRKDLKLLNEIKHDMQGKTSTQDNDIQFPSNHKLTKSEISR